eukprot:10389680-Prorocentrum_lima.AAC.1
MFVGVRRTVVRELVRALLGRAVAGVAAVTGVAGRAAYAVSEELHNAFLVIGVVRLSVNMLSLHPVCPGCVGP